MCGSCGGKGANGLSGLIGGTAVCSGNTGNGDRMGGGDAYFRFGTTTDGNVTCVGFPPITCCKTVTVGRVIIGSGAIGFISVLI